jgi:DNA modification methylase
MTWQVINGSSAEILKTYPDNSFDCVVTDPPYGINFLGKAWDSNTGDREVYEQCLRVLKPGGHLLAFSAARTYHHLAMTVETVGFEIRDQIMWIYGSGFPKSQDVGRQIDKSQNKGKYIGTGTTQMSGGPKEFPDGALPRSEKMIHEPETDEAKQWSGWGTQLKPAHEPIVMARKPVIGSIRENVLEHGTGAINIDACRVGYESEEDLNTYLNNVAGPMERSKAEDGDGIKMYEGQTGFKVQKLKVKRPSAGKRTANFADSPAFGGEAISGGVAEKEWTHNTQGRFPANVIHDGSDEVTRLFPHSTSGARKSTHKLKGLDTGEQRAVFGDDAISGKYNVQPFTDAQADEGSAARFFYCPKVSQKERNIGHQSKIVVGNTNKNRLSKSQLNDEQDIPNSDPPIRQFDAQQQNIDANNHPTVKPIELMKYLIKLVTPPNGHILDPFNGSGSTGCAAVELGFDYTGIELDPNYVEIATKRISHWEQECKPKTTYNNLFEEY